MKNSKRVNEIISWYDHENDGTKKNRTIIKKNDASIILVMCFMGDSFIALVY